MKTTCYSEVDLYSKLGARIMKKGSGSCIPCRYVDITLSCLKLTGRCRKTASGKYEITEDFWKKVDSLIEPIETGDIAFNPGFGHVLVLDTGDVGSTMLTCMQISIDNATGEWKANTDRVQSLDLMSTFRIGSSRFDVKKIKDLLNEMLHLRDKLSELTGKLLCVREDRK